MNSASYAVGTCPKCMLCRSTLSHIGDDISPYPWGRDWLGHTVLQSAFLDRYKTCKGCYVVGIKRIEVLGSFVLRLGLEPEPIDLLEVYRRTIRRKKYE